MKADYIRYSLLYKYGGIWLDSDVIVFRNLDDLIENNNHSELIQRKYDYFMKNSMLSDCYFYLGYINKENFISIKDELNKREDLIHLLKIAFDIESETNLLLHNAETIQASCSQIIETFSQG